MAEIVLSLIEPALGIGKCIEAPVGRQFNYLCCFNSNIQNLKDEAKKLDDVRDGLQMRVTAAENNAEVIVPEVKTWLENVNKIKDNMNRIENEVPNVQSGCLRIKPRFALSRRAKKAAERMKELREECKQFINSVSGPAPPAATEAGPLGNTYNFESRKKIEEDILTSLRDKINIIGICGMGGVGKTTMAKRIMKRVMEEHLFDEVLMVVVSQNVDKLKVQLEIAEKLGFKLEEETLSARADKLYDRLRDIKRKLIVLDDVWKSFKLDDLGIPCGSDFERCKILLTSRNRDVLSAMNVQKFFGLEILPEGEAQDLFRKRVGPCVDDSRLHSIAEQIIKECNGLPIALATVGVALNDKNNIHIWEDALQQLKRSNPEVIQGVIAEVYNPLELSYDHLDNKHAKSLFLLCCLFPNDENIPVEYLTYFATGLGMFDEIRSLEGARNRTHTLIEMLKDRFLLLDGLDEYHVRMHDVVRDVSIYIASKNKCINCPDCTWISSFVDGGAKPPKRLGFPNLRLLFINNQAK